jgi:hypothetical protein
MTFAPLPPERLFNLAGWLGERAKTATAREGWSMCPAQKRQARAEAAAYTAAAEHIEFIAQRADRLHLLMEPVRR